MQTVSEPKLAIDAVIERLKLTIPTVPIFRNLSRPADSAPAIAISMGSDSPTNDGTFAYELRRLEIFIDILVMSDIDDELDGRLLDIREQIEMALPRGCPLPDSPVQYFEPITQQAPQFNSDAETSAATMRLSYPAIYISRF